MKFRKTGLIVSMLVGTLLFSSCGSNMSQFEEQTRHVYKLAQDAGYEGSYEEWLNSIKGVPGKDGKEIVNIVAGTQTEKDVVYTLIYNDGSIFNVNVPIVKGDKGDKGDQGEPGQPGAQGEKGQDGATITSILKTGTNGLVDTYTITYSDGRISQFTVTNGKDGADGHDGQDGQQGETGPQGEKGDQGIQGIPGKDGHTPVVSIGDNGNWFIDDIDSNIRAQGPKGEKGDQGEQGVSVVSIKKTKMEGNVDTYTITYSNGKTSFFTVTNGVDGQDGVDGQQGIQGEKGDQGIQGIPGEDGHTPVITIGDNGNWYIDGVNSGIAAQGPKGDKGDPGKDGVDGQDGQNGLDGKDGLTPYIGENGHWWIGEEDTGKQAEGKNTSQIIGVDYVGGDLFCKEYRMRFSDGTSFNFTIDMRTDYDSKTVYGMWADIEGRGMPIFFHEDGTTSCFNPVSGKYTIENNIIYITGTNIAGPESDFDGDIIKDNSQNIVALNLNGLLYTRPDSKDVEYLGSVVKINNAGYFIYHEIHEHNRYKRDFSLLKDLNGNVVQNIEYNVNYQIEEDADYYYYFTKDERFPYYSNTCSKIAGIYAPADANCIIKNLYVSKHNQLIIDFAENYKTPGINKTCRLLKIADNKYRICLRENMPHNEYDAYFNYVLNIDSASKTFSNLEKVSTRPYSFGFDLTNDNGNFKMSVDPINEIYSVTENGQTKQYSRAYSEFRAAINIEPIIRFYLENDDMGERHLYEYDFKNNILKFKDYSTTYTGITVSNISFNYFNEINGKTYKILKENPGKIYIDGVSYDYEIVMDDLSSKIIFTDPSMKPIELYTCENDGSYEENGFIDPNDTNFDELCNFFKGKTFSAMKTDSWEHNLVTFKFNQNGTNLTSFTSKVIDEDFEGIYEEQTLTEYSNVRVKFTYDRFRNNYNEEIYYPVIKIRALNPNTRYEYRMFVYLQDGKPYWNDGQMYNSHPLTEVLTK